ncbi:hypothetical protein LSCM1_06669 [Leishmania martiniquensis]|uniref:Uncharacterized protein n=1 Tax=Leishmania martiniquensis TaxID=1580590 RepID=A0A836KSE4_9TRYP|nr:hypothetical protein LSCM1_06669 [Leishmania martiniquensis]
MANARHIAQYFADRHTAAMAAVFFAYVLAVVWCGNTGAHEAQQRISTVASHHHSIFGTPWAAERVLSTTAVVHSVSVAIVRLTEADAELLHGGPLSRPASQAERQRQLLSLPSRWQYYFAVGDFTLISAPPRLSASGMLEDWIAKMQSVYPTCVFASLAASSGNESTVNDGRLLTLTTAWQSHRRALMGDQRQQSLRVLLLDSLPAPETLRANEAATARATGEGDGGTKDPLFVFVSEDATRSWSAAVDAAELRRPPTRRWRSGASSFDAWEEMLRVTSMPAGVLRDAVAAAAASLASNDLSPSPLSLLEPLSRKEALVSMAAATDVAEYIPRLAADLADTYKAPYMIFASWCSSAGTYGWMGARMPEGNTENRTLVLALCLHNNELVELIPSRRHISRLVQ